MTSFAEVIIFPTAYISGAKVIEDREAQDHRSN